MAGKEYLSIGKIVGTRGLLGELKVESWCDSLEDFCNIKKIFAEFDTSPLDISNMRIHKSHVLIKLRSINSKSEADALRNKVLYAHKRDIPIAEDRYFIEDLIDCSVINGDGSVTYGALKDVINTGSNDIYVIEGVEGKEYMLPIIPGTVLKVDLEKNCIYINPIRGIFDDN